MTESKWVKRWGYEMAPEPVRRGIYRLKDGRLFVRVKNLPGPNGKKCEKTKVLSAETALSEAMRERDQIETTHTVSTLATLPRFSEYANDLKARKQLRGNIKSAAGRDKWTAILDHHLIPGFKGLCLDQIQRKHVQGWLDGQAQMVKEGTAKPSSVNTRLAVLRTILRAAAADHGIVDPSEGIEGLSMAEHPTYTDEQPNSLTTAELRRFLDLMFDLYPQFFAMILLGFTTGQRPSHMQPLRREGPEADVLWSEGAILIRRSHTRGQEAMNTTKTGKRQRIALPAEIVEVLRWHVATQLRTDAQRRSDLLFPSDLGTMRYTGVLHKPISDVARKMGLKKNLSAKAMRRTFQDLMREAGVHDLVTRSISGHATATMQAHYSTVAAEEQRRAGGAVIPLLPRLLTQAGVSHPISHPKACEAEGSGARSQAG